MGRRFDTWRDNGDYLALGLVGLIASAGEIARRANARYAVPSLGSADRERSGQRGPVFGEAYLQMPEKSRRKALDRCVREHGFRLCLRAFIAFERDAVVSSDRKKLAADHRYLVKAHAPGSSGSGSRAVFSQRQQSAGYKSARDSMIALLAMLRSLHWDHWTSHWVVSGSSFYGDHLLLQRLYSDALPEQIDRLGERLVGYYGVPSVRAQAVMQRSLGYVREWSKISCPIRRALVAENHLQDAIKAAYGAGKRAELLTLGLDDELMSLANQHDTNRYLLAQRLGGEHGCVGRACRRLQGASPAQIVQAVSK